MKSTHTLFSTTSIWHGRHTLRPEVSSFSYLSILAINAKCEHFITGDTTGGEGGVPAFVCYQFLLNYFNRLDKIISNLFII